MNPDVILEAEGQFRAEVYGATQTVAVTFVDPPTAFTLTFFQLAALGALGDHLDRLAELGQEVPGGGVGPESPDLGVPD